MSAQTDEHNDLNGAALRTAASVGDLAALKAALKNNANPFSEGPDGDRAFICALKNGHTACARVLLPLSDVYWVDDWGNTALEVTAKAGHAPCLALLLPYLDARHTDPLGVTALHLAAEYGHTDCVAQLLPYSNPKAVDIDGYTAFDCACRHGQHASQVLLAPSQERRPIALNPKLCTTASSTPRTLPSFSDLCRLAFLKLTLSRHPHVRTAQRYAA